MIARRWKLAIGLGLAFAAISAFIATRAEDGSADPDGIQFIGALVWRGIVYGAVDAIAMIASVAMTAVYSNFRSDKLRKPVTGDPIWSVPTLATLNPIGAPIAHAGLHVSAITHNYDTDLFVPPH